MDDWSSEANISEVPTVSDKRNKRFIRSLAHYNFATYSSMYTGKRLLNI